MEILWWLLVIISFVLGFVGVIAPVIPSVVMFWVGFLIYHFLINSETLTWMFWLVAAVLTALVFVSDLVANSYFVKKYGGSKKSEAAAIVGVIVGMFVYPPFGIIFVPFVFVLALEFINTRDINAAFRAALGSLLAFFASSAFNLVIYILLIIWFLLDAFVF
ncbi:DUF456 domain-containing protein [Lacicoccus alkaliphilus]|uniref:DUF456 domain-containing protein n=1 Tax=Lacicoccus alkaliphilus DSM 16010 TaxID=1123231 RepID=A0A1M7F1B9_9BACL|nr:DUF456 family protein [Salinicoccus alkaliphilus]SHL97793.1 hypothetical protein SAMN02745189_01300 [Salinicoccus alkaliphilus DSM 16010]